MQKCLFLVVFVLVFAGCATTQKAPEPSLEGQVSLRRVRVFNGPLAYVGQVPCTAAKIEVPRTYGVDAVAFLENGEAMVSCGKQASSVIIETGERLDVTDYRRVRTPAGFVVACLEGDSRPSELVLELTCLSA